MTHLSKSLAVFCVLSRPKRDGAARHGGRSQNQAMARAENAPWNIGKYQVAVGQNQWYHFGVGEFTTHFRTYFSWIG